MIEFAATAIGAFVGGAIGGIIVWNWGYWYGKKKRK